MKGKQLLLLLFFSLTILGSFAQGIRFEQGKSWKQIVQKARKSRQLIFVDCYTSWCGPCRAMTTTVFTQDTVGIFFNIHTVNAKVDMEKEADGRMLREKYRVESFPTFLFIDPFTQQEVHRMVGQMSVNDLLQEAAIAIDPQNNIAGMANRYAAGERSPGLLLSYQQALEKAMYPLNSQIAREYLDSLSLEQLATEMTWNKIVKYVDDLLAKPLQLVIANRDRFYAIAGREAVDYKIQYVLNNTVKQLISQRDRFDEKRYAEVRNCLRSLDDIGASGGLAYLYAYSCERKGDFQGLLQNIREALKYNLFRKSAGVEYLNRFLPVFQKCEDRRTVKEVIELICQKCSDASSWYEKADLMKLKAMLQYGIGDIDGAEQSRTEEKAYRRQGDEAGEWM